MQQRPDEAGSVRATCPSAGTACGGSGAPRPSADVHEHDQRQLFLPVAEEVIVRSREHPRGV